MTELVLFHSAYGLRPAVRDAAERFRRLGLTVHAPDLYEGKTADNINDAMAIRNSIGVPALIERAQAALSEAGVGPGAIYAGFSMGAAAAQYFAGVDPTTRGLLLLHGAAGIEGEASFAFPIQHHVAEGDEYATSEEIAEWEEEVRKRGGEPETFWYPRGGHLYTDPDLVDYDADSASVTWERAEAFIAALRN